jgi:cytoskeletal protein CcmA (bactofilin family)
MNFRTHPRFQRRLKQIGVFLVAALLLPLWLIWFPSIGLANETGEPKSITIPAQEVINDDLYLWADNITIDGIVKGDAIVSAKQITINGTVEGDLIAAAQVVTVNGTVNDDIRMAGQILVLGESARIKDDVIAAGYSLENKVGSSVGGNLNYLGGQALLAGTVQQNVKGAMVALQIAGQVKGKMDVAVGNHELSMPPSIPDAPTMPKVAAGLTLTKTAQVGGELRYHSADPAKIEPGAVVSGKVVQEGEGMMSDVAPPVKAGHGILFHIQRFLALLLVGWLLLRFVLTWTQTLAETVQAKPLPALGWGVVSVAAFVATAIALSILTVVLLVISGLLLPSLALPMFGIGWLGLSALFLGFGIVAGFLPPIVLSFLGGRWLLAKFRPEQPSSNLMMLIVGLVGFVLVTAIPVVGDILGAIATFLGLGAFWLWSWQQLKRDRIDHHLPLATA